MDAHGVKRFLLLLRGSTVIWMLIVLDFNLMPSCVLLVAVLVARYQVASAMQLAVPPEGEEIWVEILALREVWA